MCDTEVIIYAYKEWGEKAFSYFDGMFAFGLWDQKKKKLLLFRDRRGVKPLYWAKLGDDIFPKLDSKKNKIDFSKISNK